MQSQDRNLVAEIQEIMIVDVNHLSNSWFFIEILAEFYVVIVEVVDPSGNDSEYRIVVVQLPTPTGTGVLDYRKAVFKLL